MSQQNNIEVRKIPKKTVIIMVIISVICFLGFLFIMMTKNMKMQEVLSTLGYKSISNIEVINKLNVEDKETKIKSTVYKVFFFDETTQNECIGFVIRSNRGQYSKDIDCKKKIK